jgi:hypothetical protein
MINIGDWLALECYPLKVYMDYSVYSYIEYPHPLSPQTSVSPPLDPKGEEQHTVAGEGLGGIQFRRLERKPGTLFLKVAAL